MERKKITMRKILFITLLLVGSLAVFAQSDDGHKERQYFVEALTKIADPVLDALSKNQLRAKMPVEGKTGDKRKYCSHLEAFGRLLDGMAPWLELGPDNTPEGQLRKKYIDLAV